MSNQERTIDPGYIDTGKPAPGGGARMSRPELRGRASGVAVLAFFAVAWSGWAVSSAPAAVEWAVQIPACLATIALFITAALIYRRAACAPSGGDRARGRQISRRFGLVVAAEFIGLVAVAAIVGATGHAVAIPAVICFGVGIHFFPLGRLFDLPLYHGSGVGLCVAAIVATVLALATGSTIWWVTVSGFGAAAALYATSLLLARQTWRRV